MLLRQKLWYYGTRQISTKIAKSYDTYTYLTIGSLPLYKRVPPPLNACLNGCSCFDQNYYVISLVLDPGSPRTQ